MLNIIIGLLSGVISGMGIGGGAILIPALIFFQGVSQQVAQGINLVYFLPTALASLFVHIRNKNVEVKTALIIGYSGMLGAAGGAFLATRMLEGELLKKMFGGFLLLIGVYEILKGFQMRKEKSHGLR
ncbi:MAG: sulfite exporter TauE/SafE family protein [Clostridia bacterium]|nr:sulfite exporter TauE/SafE family protein [Clostridia bacterium]